jgi:transcriptional regulator with XRE-family HTH domain
LTKQRQHGSLQTVAAGKPRNRMGNEGMAKKKQLRPRKASGRMASKGLPNPIDVHVGQRVRVRRTLLGMSQEALADAIGLTFQQVQKYEKGSNRVSSSRLLDIANVLDVSVSYFFEEMASGVADQTPSMLWHADALPDIDLEKDPMAKRETLEFVRAYYSIRQPDVRKRLRELVASVARNR